MATRTHWTHPGSVPECLSRYFTRLGERETKAEKVCKENPDLKKAEILPVEE